MRSASNESQLLLAIEVIQQDPSLSCRAIAKIYNVDFSTLCRRLRRQPSRRDCIANSRRLNNLEESAIVQYILDLDSQGFPPRLPHVEDMANRLLRQRDTPRVGKNWTTNFVKRQPELKTRFARKYDYQRALCEDPTLIRNWFMLVQNTMARYGIAVPDVYNFDESGFMMGIIAAAMVATGAERRGKPKIAQPGNREWVTVIQGVNSQGWALLEGELTSLQRANDALSKRRRAKRTRIKQGGPLSLQEGQSIIDQRDSEQQMRQEMRKSGGQRKRVETKPRRCGRCGNIGHNMRTCQEDVDIPSQENHD